THMSERRVDLKFPISYSDDPAHAEQVLLEIVQSHEKVLKEPAPMVKLHEFGESSMNFVVRPWVKTEDYWDVYWDITRAVKQRFDEEGLSIPYPHREIRLIQPRSVADQVPERRNSGFIQREPPPPPPSAKEPSHS